MSTINEHALWEQSIYRIQVTDPILGGPDGIINIQPTQLANRTAWLKSRIQAEHDEQGKHHITGGMVSPSAGIDQNKLHLDVSMAELRTLLGTVSGLVNTLQGDVGTLIGSDILGPVQLMWEYSDFGMAFEMFTDNPSLSLRDAGDRVVQDAFAGDNSVDTSSIDGLWEGQHLLLYDETGSEEVVISRLLPEGRIVFTQPLTRSLVSGKLGNTNWSIQHGKSQAADGTTYISEVTRVNANAPYGVLAINHAVGETATYSVWSRDARSDDVWTTSELISEEHDVSFYKVQGGYTQFKVVVSGESEINHMALYPKPSTTGVAAVRKPEVTTPLPGCGLCTDEMSVASSDFRTAYQDKFSHAQYEFRTYREGTIVKTYTTTSTSRTSIGEEDAVSTGRYSVRCRHLSDMGDWSAWSEPITVTIQEAKKFFGFIGARRSTGFGEFQFASLNEHSLNFGAVL